MKIETFVVPTKDKEILIKPAYEDIPGLIDSNIERFKSYKFNIRGIPFPEFRKHARTEILEKAGKYSEWIWSICSRLEIGRKRDSSDFHNPHNSRTPDKPIIQTGYPPILAHPGILIKDSLVNTIAEKTKGIGINMVVDNDTCHDNWLNIPNINRLEPSTEKIEFIPNLQGLAFEEAGHTDLTQLTTFKKDVLRILSNPDMKDTFTNFIDIGIKLCKEIQRLSDLFTSARCAYLQKFSINNLEIPVSLICETESFLNFFLHITKDIRNFARIYNAKLEEYRKLKRISSKANPLPDLKEKGHVIELPFWIWKENEPRKQLFASIITDKQINLMYENIIVTSLDFCGNGNQSDNLQKLRNLISIGIKIRPKAIVNTMYSRMFFSDLFIHGVGGAKYDLITDEIIRTFFGVEPPGYAIITATLHLPYKPHDVSSEDIRKLKHVIKDMDYNPERYASGKIMEDAEMKSMVNEKKKLITAEMHNGEEKHRTFSRLKQLNSLMKEKIEPLIEEREKETEEVEKKLIYNSIVTNREYPFCIYPESMLRELFSRVKVKYN
ncbi:MAG: hypothetical protein V3T09_05160 [bacterium]